MNICGLVNRNMIARERKTGWFHYCGVTRGGLKKQEQLPQEIIYMEKRLPSASYIQRALRPISNTYLKFEHIQVQLVLSELKVGVWYQACVILKLKVGDWDWSRAHRGVWDGESFPPVQHSYLHVPLSVHSQASVICRKISGYLWQTAGWLIKRLPN